MLSGGSSPGQMKATLSHLQFENEQLKTEVAKLKEENRSMDDRLVQEQMHNGDLAARLDDARNLLRDRGIDSETRVGARSRSTRTGNPDEELSQPRTLPAGRTSKKPRKPPAASIPGDLDDLPTAPDREDAASGTISFKDNDAPPLRHAFSDDPGPASDEDDQLRWQPVASDPSRATPRK